MSKAEVTTSPYIILYFVSLNVSREWTAFAFFSFRFQKSQKNLSCEIMFRCGMREKVYRSIFSRCLVVCFSCRDNVLIIKFWKNYETIAFSINHIFYAGPNKRPKIVKNEPKTTKSHRSMYKSKFLIKISINPLYIDWFELRKKNDKLLYNLTQFFHNISSIYSRNSHKAN